MLTCWKCVLVSVKIWPLTEVRKHFPLCQKCLEDFLNSWALFSFCKQWSKTVRTPWQWVEGGSSFWRCGNGCDCNSNAKLLDLTNVQKKMLPITSQNWWLSTAISPLSIYSLLFLSLERLEKAQSGQIILRPTVLVLCTHRMKYRQRNKKNLSLQSSETYSIMVLLHLSIC